jgi:hypothetical protein
MPKSPVIFLLAITAALSCTREREGDNEQTLPDPGRSPGTHGSQQSFLLRYNLGNKHPRQLKLPGELKEASGLAVSNDGRLFCHDDESGIVYQVDFTTGKIDKQFALGSGFLGEDFEGIAIKNDTMFLVSGNGSIFEFREGLHKGRVEFRLHRTPLNARYDVEGLEYDPETDCLLLACKSYPGKGLSGFRAVYSFSLGSRQLVDVPRFLVRTEDVQRRSRKGKFSPSGMARHPKSGTFFIISASAGSIIELSREGVLLAQEEIPSKVNSQPEGITFGPDLTMIICNDGQEGDGSLTLYPLGE